MDLVGNRNVVDDLRVLIQNLHSLLGLLVLEPHPDPLKPLQTLPNTHLEAYEIFVLDGAALDLFQMLSYRFDVYLNTSGVGLSRPGLGRLVQGRQSV